VLAKLCRSVVHEVCWFAGLAEQVDCYRVSRCERTASDQIELN